VELPNLRPGCYMNILRGILLIYKGRHFANNRIAIQIRSLYVNINSGWLSAAVERPDKGLELHAAALRHAQDVRRDARAGCACRRTGNVAAGLVSVIH